jgi:hypothetical protein
MALPVENLTVEQLAMERADRKAKAAAIPSGTPGQRLLRDFTMALVESREVNFLFVSWVNVLIDLRLLKRFEQVEG